MTIGKKIKNKRIELNMSQGDLTKKTGIKREYISKMENNHLSNPTLETLRKIAKAFGISVSKLLENLE